MEGPGKDEAGTSSREIKKSLSESKNTTDISSDDNDDLVTSINYNTITSLAALKDILQGDGNDTPEADSFFHHYFMNHCNNLSTRNSISPFPYSERRRLSQCREEDEDNEKKDKSPLPSTVPSDSNITKLNNKKKTESKEIDQQGDVDSDKIDDAQKRTVMGVHHKFLVTTAKQNPVEKALLKQTHNAHTVHFGTKGPEEIRPNVKTIFEPTNLHKDKKYFDSSLIEIRSKVDDITTPTEDVWIKRDEPKPVSSFIILLRVLNYQVGDIIRLTFYKVGHALTYLTDFLSTYLSKI